MKRLNRGRYHKDIRVLLNDGSITKVEKGDSIYINLEGVEVVRDEDGYFEFYPACTIKQVTGFGTRYK